MTVSKNSKFVIRPPRKSNSLLRKFDLLKLGLFLLLVVLTASFASQTIFAANYYVKPTGSDANSGLSESLAWQHIMKAATTLVAGDTVFIRAGTYSEWNPFDSADIGGGGIVNSGFIFKNNGTDDSHRIVAKAYHGDAKPLILGATGSQFFVNSRTWRSPAYIVDRRYWTYDSLEFRYGRRGIWVYSGVGITIRNCTIDSTVGDVDNNNGGVTTFQNGTFDVRRLVVDGNTIFANGCWNSSGGIDYVNGFNTSGCHFYGIDSSVISNNIIYNEDAGIHVKGAQPGGVPGSEHNIRVFGNVIHDVTEAGIWFVGQGQMYDFQAYNNVIYNAAPGIMLVSGDGTSNLHSVKIYNNTIDCNGKGGIQSEYGRIDSCEIFNNIIVNSGLTTSDGTSAIGFKNSSQNPTNFYEDYNLYNGRSDHTYYVYPANTPYTIPTWQSATVWGDHSTEANPLFVNSGARDYHLQAGSPAVSGGRGGSYPTYRGALSTGAPDVTPPVISGVASGTITATSATITWNTDETSTSQINYGLTTAYGSSTTLDGNFVTSHSQPITGLAASTLYHYRVRSKDGAGNETVGTDNTLTTAATDVTAPTISSVASGSITTTSATITWSTNEAATSQINYGLTTAYGSTTTLDATLVTSHSQQLSSLTAGTTYHYRVRSKDGSNNEAVGTDNTFATTAADITPPTISNVQVSNIVSNGATVTWTTNEPATSQIAYGLTTGYGSTTTLDATLVTSHSQNITGLAASTLYNFQVRSSDASNNAASGTNATFTTIQSLVNLVTGLGPGVSTTYAGYSVAEINDGTIDPYGGTSTTWASDESAVNPQWVEFDFGSTKTVYSVSVYWAWNGFSSSWTTSQQYKIQSWNGSSYVDVTTVTNPAAGNVTTTSFTPVATSKIRIYQPANMGSPNYSTVIWVTEIQASGLTSPDTTPPAAIKDLH